jgi:DNA-binding XRE family transcriptional regulator
MGENVQELITIAELRARKGKMTQAELAQVLGTTQTTVSQWEKDIYSISTPYLVKLCRYFGVSSNKILGI